MGNGDWELYAEYHALRSWAGSRLELRDAADLQHLNIAIRERNGGIRGIELKDEDAVDLALRILKLKAPERLAAPEPFKPGEYVRNGDLAQVFRLVHRVRDDRPGKWWVTEYNAEGRVQRGNIQIDRPSAKYERVKVEVVPATPETWTVVE